MAVCPQCQSELPDGARFCHRCGKALSDDVTGVVPAAPAPVLDEAVRVDEVIDGRYKVLKRLGGGGMGSVYACLELSLEREVAIKLPSPSLLSDRSLIDRFEREGRLTARLDHPNIVPIYGFGRHGNIPYLVMKRLEGTTMAHWIRHAPDDPLAAMQLLTQAAAGVDHMHGHELTHRDIKPANIFVSSKNHVTLLDFGILRDHRDGATQAGTALGTVLGTIRYMSPEQALGKSRGDVKSDLYALGLVAYELLTRRPPFDAESELAWAHAHASEKPRRAEQLGTRVADVLDRALAKDPAQRYPSGEALVKALTSAQAATPARVLGATTGPRKPAPGQPDPDRTSGLPPAARVPTPANTVAGRPPAPAAPPTLLWRMAELQRAHHTGTFDVAAGPQKRRLVFRDGVLIHALSSERKEGFEGHLEQKGLTPEAIAKVVHYVQQGPVPLHGRDGMPSRLEIQTLFAQQAEAVLAGLMGAKETAVQTTPDVPPGLPELKLDAIQLVLGRLLRTGTATAARVKLLPQSKRRFRFRDELAKRRLLATAGKLAWMDDAESKPLGEWLSRVPDREVSLLAGLVELEELVADASATAVRPAPK